MVRLKNLKFARRYSLPFEKYIYSILVYILFLDLYYLYLFRIEKVGRNIF